MPKYRFIVQSPSGKARRGTISEKDEESARAALRRAGFKVVSLTESADLVVHTPSGGATSGRPRVKPERAAIIEFEESPWDRFTRILNTYVLRREMAILLALVGVVWLVVSWINKPEKAPPPEPEFNFYTFVGRIDNSSFPDVGRAMVRIPELPYTETVDFESDAPPHEVTLSIEATRQPRTVEVTLIEGTKTKVAHAGTTLQAGEQAGTFTFDVSDFQIVENEE